MAVEKQGQADYLSTLVLWNHMIHLLSISKSIGPCMSKDIEVLGSSIISRTNKCLWNGLSKID